MKITKPNIRELVLKHGITFPSNEELIMLILGSGSGENSIKSISKKVSTILYDSAENEIVENLMKIKGMGSSKSLAIAAAIELGRRRNCHKNAVIKCPRDVVPFLKNYSMRTKEHFICVTLNGGHEIIQIRVVSVGTLNKTIVHPREIFSDALKEMQRSNPELFKKYKIFSIEGSYETGTFSESNILNRLSYYGAENMDLDVEEIRYLSDQNGMSFFEQAIQYEKEKTKKENQKAEEKD